MPWDSRKDVSVTLFIVWTVVLAVIVVLPLIVTSLPFLGYLIGPLGLLFIALIWTFGRRVDRTRSPWGIGKDVFVAAFVAWTAVTALSVLLLFTMPSAPILGYLFVPVGFLFIAFVWALGRRTASQAA
jgi:hypothetical protein